MDYSERFYLGGVHGEVYILVERLEDQNLQMPYSLCYPNLSKTQNPEVLSLETLPKDLKLPAE